MQHFLGSANSNREAKLKYLANDLHVLQPGSFVTCAVSGQKISLEELRYWSVELQEPYANAELSLQRYLQSTRTKPPITRDV
jgi:hypothetical protein